MRVLTYGSKPKPRRPIAVIFRRTANHAVDFCWKRHIHPNTVSLASLVAGAAAAASLLVAGSLKPGLESGWEVSALLYGLALVAAVVCGALRLWLNMLDGMVAQATGQTSPLGEVFNELPDRISDLLIFTALAVSGLCQPSLALAAAIASLLIAYTGTLAQAVGAGRQFGGLMSKPWRMVVVAGGLLVPLVLSPVWTSLTTSLAAWLTFSATVTGAAAPAIGPALDQGTLLVSGLGFMDWMLLFLLAGSFQTLWVRLRGIRQSLQRSAGRQSFGAFHTPRAAA